MRAKALGLGRDLPPGGSWGKRLVTPVNPWPGNRQDFLHWYPPTPAPLGLEGW